MKVELITKTTHPEMSMTQLLAHIARVSNPANQHNHDTADKLLLYCLKNKHWSVFEHAHLTISIETSRAIAAQILRHRSFCFQEFSQRYAEAVEFEPTEARRQDTKNRQNSFDDLSQEDKDWWASELEDHQTRCYNIYGDALARGIAKECARMILPLSTQTKLYVTGNIRSWIHYCGLRCHESTQKEHREIAWACREILLGEIPCLSFYIGEPE